MNSSISIPAKHPKKNPAKVPNPKSSGVNINEPATAPTADTQNILFEGRGRSAPAMPDKKSIASAIMEKTRRNKIIVKLSVLKPVSIAYTKTSTKMITVPGNPNKEK
jgi:hypothetical protein